MKRPLLIAAVVASIVAPAGASTTELLDTAAVEPAVADLPEPASEALAVAHEVRDLAAEFPAGAPLAEQLAAAARLGHHAEPSVQAPRDAGFAEAMRALYRAAGVAPVRITPPEPAVAAAVAPMIEAVARAITLTERALADITPAERRWAARHVDLFETPWSEGAERLADIAARVDMDAMNQAAAVIATAADALPDQIPAASSWIDPTGAIEIGGTGNELFGSDRVLLLDLGGDDVHMNSAGAVGAVPGNTLGVPVSVTLDLGGNDFYYTAAPNQVENTAVAQGVGIGGVGMLVDRWGNDVYLVALTGNLPHECVGDIVFAGFPGRFPQIVHAQGTGALGVGAVADLSGSDFFWISNYIGTPNNCHFVRAYSHGQGAGLQRGVGVLIDDLGNDVRGIDTFSFGFQGYPGAQDFIAGSNGQGFGAGGAGLVVDKEGNDITYANALAQWNFVNANKGAFATTFVQGAVAGLTHDHSAAATPPVDLPPQAAIGLPCAGGGSAGPQGERSSQRCQAAGIGLHVDVLGSDTFIANASSLQGSGFLCTVGSVALVVAQGSAAWGGVGALANLDMAGRDEFSIQPYAAGSPCYADGTRAVGVGQGFGGAVRYPIWDDPDAWYAGVDQYSSFNAAGGITARLAVPAVGVLVSAGPACPPADPKAGGDLSIGCTADLDEPTDSPDRYQSFPYALNQQGTALAESWVQGSGGRPRPNGSVINTPAGAFAPPLPWGMGIGVHVDVGGDDDRLSSPTVGGGGPGSSSISVAQGATEGGIGALLDLFGDDSYASTPQGPTTSTLHQGDARAGFREPIPPIAVIVDVGGNDVYGPSITCQGNGGFPAWLLWGNLGTCGTQAGTLIIGLDAASGVGM